MPDIDELLSRLNPRTAKAFTKASEQENRLLPTPSLNLNRAIGGFGFGRQSMVWGNKGTGKSVFLQQQCAIAQKLNVGVGWIDAEKNYDPDWAKRLGVNPDQIGLSKITSIADMADASHDLISAGFGLIVVDSISALLPQSYFTDKGEMKDLANTGQIGTFSKNMGTACNMINNMNKETAFVLVSQVRNQITSNGASASHMGGKAVEHMNSTTLRLWCMPSEIGSITGKTHVGNKILEKPVGNPVTWTVDKNRGPGTKETAKFDLYFKGDFVGVDRTGEIADAAVDFGLVSTSGAWYQVQELTEDGKGVQGRPNFVKWLRQNPKIEEEWYGEIIAKSV